jgi:serine protease Do
VVGVEQFTRLVRETPPGRQAKIVVWRNGAQQTLEAAMGARSEAQGLMQNSPWFGSGPMTMPRGPITMPPMPQMDIPQFQLSWQNPVLGIEGESVNSQLAEFFGVKDGVLVRSVSKNSAAEKAGIKAGDVIVKVDNSNVSSTREITSVLRAIREKKSFPVTVVRNKQEMTVTVTIDNPSGGGVRAELRTVRV